MFTIPGGHHYHPLTKLHLLHTRLCASQERNRQQPSNKSYVFWKRSIDAASGADDVDDVGAVCAVGPSLNVSTSTGPSPAPLSFPHKATLYAYCRVRWTDTDRRTKFASNATLLCISSVVIALRSDRSIGQTGAHHYSDWRDDTLSMRSTKGWVESEGRETAQCSCVVVAWSNKFLLLAPLLVQPRICKPGRSRRWHGMVW